MYNNVTSAQLRRWETIRQLGCIVRNRDCMGRITIHHCGTKMGCRKDHDKVIGLCWEHHLGSEGVDGKKMSKRGWQDKYGTEEYLLYKTSKLLGEKNGQE